MHALVTFFMSFCSKNVEDVYTSKDGIFSFVSAKIILTLCINGLPVLLSVVSIPIRSEPRRTLKPSSLCIDASTIDPAMSKKVAGIADTLNSSFVDAPVSGGTPILTGYRRSLLFPP